jgi:4-hydroxy-tetrahydrodipicolinate reductase
MTAKSKRPATVGITGACGRMGVILVKLVAEDPSLKLGAALEAPGHPNLGVDAGTACGVGRALGVPLSAALAADVDVVIDFSLPAGTMAVLDACVKRGIPMVVGTTGLDADQKARLDAAARKIPIVFAPNYSVGINLLLRIVGDVAKTLGEDYDCEIVEMHHRFKKDAPSGTALKLAEAIARATGRDLQKDGVFGRSGVVGERKKGEIGVLSLRGGDVVGDHTITFATMGERVELTHKASSRETFARGALRAAKFVVAGRKPGLYSMLDVMGL